VALANEMGARVERAIALGENGRTRIMYPSQWGPNLLAEGAIFFLSTNMAAPAGQPEPHSVDRAVRA